MLLGISLGLLIVLTTFAQRIHKDLDNEGTWVVLWLGGGLIVLGAIAPSVWIGLILAWIGLQIPWLETLGRWGKLPPNATLAQILPKQGATLIAGGLYVAFAYSGLALKSLPYIAAILVIWALINSLSGEFSAYRGGELPFRETLMEGYPESALVGSNFMFGWLSAIGTLSCIYLTLEWHWAWVLPLPFLVIALVLAKNLTGFLSGLVGLATYVAFRADWWQYLILLFGLACLFFGGGMAMQRGLAPGQRWSQLATRMRGWRLMKPHISWHGRGLGYFRLLNFRTPEDELAVENSGTPHERYVTRTWDHAHNEWLQGLIELGLPPLLFAAAYIVGHVVNPGSPFAVSILLLTFTQSLTYFPLHFPGQVLPLLIAMAALDLHPPT